MNKPKKRRERAITEACELGFERGNMIASWTDIPEVGTELCKSIDWQGIDTIENEKDQMDAMEMMAFESESNDRQFTPFEFTASEFNKHELSEELWEAFDQGITEGIQKNIRKRINQHKG